MDISVWISDFQRHLTFLNRSPETIKGYQNALFNFLSYFNRQPKDITKEETIDYLITLPVFSRKTAIASLKSFYQHCLNSNKLDKLEYPSTPEYTPEILSLDEIAALIEAATNVKHRTIIMLLYTTGMRVMELINLRWDCIDRKTMTIHIKAGKGNKDRPVKLTESMKDQLIRYCKAYGIGCFESANPVFSGAKKNKYTRRSIETFLYKYAALAKIKKKVTPHILRHCMATHLRERGVDLAIIQDLLGHKNPNTTRIYSKLTNLKLIPDLLASG